MSNTLAIFKKELRSICSVLRLRTASSLHFYWYRLGCFSGWAVFFLENQSHMRAFFGLMPWMFLFIAPATTMRLWAEEKKMGTVEILMTLPVRSYEVILGKYLASFVLFAVMICLTFPVPALVFYLGSSRRWADFRELYRCVLDGGGIHRDRAMCVNADGESDSCLHPWYCYESCIFLGWFRGYAAFELFGFGHPLHEYC